MGVFRGLIFHMDWQFFDVWCGLPNYLPMSVGLSVWTTREPGLPNKTSPDPGHALSPHQEMYLTLEFTLWMWAREP
jgi:hypothetical protein